MNAIVVREYAQLTTDSGYETLDQATVTASAFEWLCDLTSGFSSGGARLAQIENTRWLRLDNYVGVVQTPCGTLLEILPKHTEKIGDEATKQSRDLLKKMLAVALDLTSRETDMANIEMFDYPLPEWVMKNFISSLDHLVKRGLRSDYIRVEEEQRFLRGQLDVVKQMRQPPGRAHIFNIRHDIFSPDRPENRLLKSALMLVCKTTKQADTWRLSHELAGLLSEIPSSSDIKNDFRLWRKDRLMAHYQPVRPWCELVLGQQMPVALSGKTHGMSMLFPMEKLFEQYVEVQLRKQLPAKYVLKAQAASRSLCKHLGEKIFQLRPDFLVLENSKPVVILDTKWKLINSADRKNKYGLSQTDFYQLFAYGHKHLNGSGKMLLIYPKTDNFDAELPAFTFSDEVNPPNPPLKLWVVPFDLENDEMLWPKEWEKSCFFATAIG
jgi:5-methylcytosine-specific restriction enzyme subunit McrC